MNAAALASTSSPIQRQAAGMKRLAIAQAVAGGTRSTAAWDC